VWVLAAGFGVVGGDGVGFASLGRCDLALKKQYPVDIAASVDLPLALGLVWAINFNYLQTFAAAGGVAAT